MTLLDAAKRKVLQPAETSPIVRVTSTPIGDTVARAFQWNPRIDGSDTGPKNRLAKKRGFKPKKKRSDT